MEINETSLNATTVLALVGRLDVTACPGLDQKVDALIGAGRHRIVYDCSHLDYVSSAGLRVFLVSAKKLKPLGGKAAFAAVTPAVREILELSGFSSVMEIHPSVGELA
ncbi:MAG TPA: STAS domain-containing protein [Opitutus sp.]|nr:STAS domain-containing protein [Opitutus sp.]